MHCLATDPSGVKYETPVLRWEELDRREIQEYFTTTSPGYWRTPFYSKQTHPMELFCLNEILVLNNIACNQLIVNKTGYPILRIDPSLKSVWL